MLYWNLPSSQGRRMPFCRKLLIHTIVRIHNIAVIHRSDDSDLCQRSPFCLSICNLFRFLAPPVVSVNCLNQNRVWWAWQIYLPKQSARRVGVTEGAGGEERWPNMQLRQASLIPHDMYHARHGVCLTFRNIRRRLSFCASVFNSSVFVIRDSLCKSCIPPLLTFSSVSGRATLVLELCGLAS